MAELNALQKLGLGLQMMSPYSRDDAYRYALSHQAMQQKEAEKDEQRRMALKQGIQKQIMDRLASVMGNQSIPPEVRAEAEASYNKIFSSQAKDAGVELTGIPGLSQSFAPKPDIQIIDRGGDKYAVNKNDLRGGEVFEDQPVPQSVMDQTIAQDERKRQLDLKEKIAAEQRANAEADRRARNTDQMIRGRSETAVLANLRNKAERGELNEQDRKQLEILETKLQGTAEARQVTAYQRTQSSLDSAYNSNLRKPAERISRADAVLQVADKDNPDSIDHFEIVTALMDLYRPPGLQGAYTAEMVDQMPGLVNSVKAAMKGVIRGKEMEPREFNRVMDLIEKKRAADYKYHQNGLDNLYKRKGAEESGWVAPQSFQPRPKRGNTNLESMSDEELEAIANG